jgi:hypothetical protein
VELDKGGCGIRAGWRPNGRITTVLVVCRTPVRLPKTNGLKSCFSYCIMIFASLVRFCSYIIVPVADLNIVSGHVY